MQIESDRTDTSYCLLLETDLKIEYLPYLRLPRSQLSLQIEATSKDSHPGENKVQQHTKRRPKSESRYQNDAHASGCTSIYTLHFPREGKLAHINSGYHYLIRVDRKTHASPLASYLHLQRPIYILRISHKNSFFSLHVHIAFAIVNVHLPHTQTSYHTERLQVS